MHQIRQMSAVYPVDHQTFLSAAENRLLRRLRRRVPARNPRQHVRVFNIHDDMLGVVDLLFHGDTEIAFENRADAPRQ